MIFKIKKRKLLKEASDLEYTGYGLDDYPADDDVLQDEYEMSGHNDKDKLMMIIGDIGESSRELSTLFSGFSSHINKSLMRRLEGIAEELLDIESELRLESGYDQE